MATILTLEFHMGKTQLVILTCLCNSRFITVLTIHQYLVDLCNINIVSTGQTGLCCHFKYLKKDILTCFCRYTFFPERILYKI